MTDQIPPIELREITWLGIFSNSAPITRFEKEIARMKTLFVLLAIPGFVVAGQISGKVIDLSGNPLAGVMVEGKRESDITKPSGSWILGVQAHREPSASLSRRVSSNLVFQNGRMRVSWSGRGADGRLAQNIRQEQFLTAAPRNLRAAQAETLWVYWKGKRLAVRPVESEDTSGISIRIDTSWNDDAGIPWNPDVQYGTLRDQRDGNVYRTVQIGDQTWMAEGLRLQTESYPEWLDEDLFWFPTYSQDIWGRLALPLSADSLAKNRWGSLFARNSFDSTQLHTVCPTGWLVPSLRDVFGLASRLESSADTVASLEDFLRDSLKLTGLSLRTSTGWPKGLEGIDALGFRLVPTGFTLTNEVLPGAGNRPEGGRETLSGVGGFWVSDSWSGLESLELGPEGGYVFESGRSGGEANASDARIVRTGIYGHQAAPIRCIEGRK
ncbi:MAG: hypothetical protein RL173_1192 [Fibrobacterota bacterium]|jgi:uncharacterized protein (TIGR02145 family)